LGERSARFSGSPARSILPGAGPPASNPALSGDIELVNFEQYSISKL